MNILLVYPYYPDSYWGFKNALKFVSKKAALPPLGLITVSAILPKTWNKKLIDLNTSKITPDDYKWADYVFISAMYIQKDSVEKILKDCIKYKVKTIAGGPLFTQEYLNYPEIDHFVLNEAEITLPLFIEDLLLGKEIKKIYQTSQFADMTLSPIPDFDLLNFKDYLFMSIQISRGCPYDCEFCEITALLGHKVRLKKTDQVISELQKLYNLKWEGPVSIVDDNFIGNIKYIKSELLPAIHHWMKAHNNPFTFSIEASINLADDKELLKQMVESNFKSVFIGIETPDENSLEECNKIQNKNRNLIENIKKIQNAGMIVSGGFIVGFDSDSPSTFQNQINFIQKSGIVSAMVGLLNAPKNTRLYKRLQLENRLFNEATGNNTDTTINFIPKMNYKDLLTGYRKIILEIYSPKPYSQRIKELILNYRKHKNKPTKFNIQISKLKALIKSIFLIGVVDKGRYEYWKLLFWTLLHRPTYIPNVIEFQIYGYHFRTVYNI